MKYTPDEGDLVRLFYVPALRSAVRYDRQTGYFSARALAQAAGGIEGLVVNNGRMRLIVSRWFGNGCRLLRFFGEGRACRLFTQKLDIGLLFSFTCGRWFYR